MNESLRPWFYAACLIVWLVVGPGPAMHQMNLEQERLDDTFYAKYNAPPLKQLFDDSTVLMARLEKMKTWEEYGSCLKDLQMLDVYTWKNQRSKPSMNEESFRYSMMLRGRSSSMHNLLMQKGTELGNKKVPGLPEHGFSYGPRAESASFNHFWFAVWSSWVFAFLILLVRLEACGFKIWLEVFSPHILLLALATLLWPVGLFKYPTGDPARQLVQSLRFATFALTTAIGLTPSMAFAQQVKKDDGKKGSSSSHTLFLDFRNTEVAGPDPNPELLVKATLTTPTGWVIQSTDVQRQNRSWSTTKLAGHIAFNKNGVRMDAVGGMSKNSTGAVTASAGAIASVNRSRFVTAFPIIAFERRVDKPMNDFTFANQTLLKLGAWRAGVEMSFKKVFNNSAIQYYVGGVVGRNVGKKAYVELASYRDQTGAWRIRGRSTYALSW